MQLFLGRSLAANGIMLPACGRLMLTVCRLAHCANSLRIARRIFLPKSTDARFASAPIQRCQIISMMYLNYAAHKFFAWRRSSLRSRDFFTVSPALCRSALLSSQSSQAIRIRCGVLPQINKSNVTQCSSGMLESKLWTTFFAGLDPPLAWPTARSYPAG